MHDGAVNGLHYEPGEIASIRIDRPDRGNAVTPDLMRALVRHLEDAAEDDRTRVVVLSGTGKVFCAGADIKEMHARWTREGLDAFLAYQRETWMPTIQEGVLAIWDFPLPIVAALNGSATAGGLDIALCCDYRIASSTARLGESYANLGILPVGGGAFLVPRVAPGGRATKMLLSGELVTAEEALSMGLVDEVVAPHELADRTAEIAESFARAEPLMARALKEVERAPDRGRLIATMEASLEANRRLLGEEVIVERRRKLMAAYERRRETS